jgi:hypothetical protein
MITREDKQCDIDVDQLYKKIQRLQDFLLDHLESDTDDFTGYFGQGIDEHTFHIYFKEIKSILLNKNI